MATDASDKIRITNLETQFGLFLADTIAPEAMSNVQRKRVENSLFPIINGLRTRKIENGDYTAFEIGDVIDHIDEANKKHYAGKVKSASFSGLADINDPTKFDRYESDRV